MATYTVMLLYPDYVSADYPFETWLSSVSADNPEDAVDQAREQCVYDNNWTQDPAIDPDDFYVLAVFEGSVPDVKPW